MYSIDVLIEGSAPLLQHRFGIEAQTQMALPAKKATGHKDYSNEWKDTLYSLNGYLAQPGIHIEMAMSKAATGYKLPGARGKTYKDLFIAKVSVKPDMLLHLDQVGKEIPIPEQLEINNYEKPIYIDYRPVVVNRGSRIGRTRLAFSPGWRVHFCITVNDDQIQLNVVQQVLAEAGQSVGIGDYRPRYGRFRIVQFEKVL